MEEVFQFLKDAKTFYLATVDGDQPRVRPFGAIAAYEGRIYIQTGNIKNVFKQMDANPKIEISAMKGMGEWIRIEAKAVRDPRREAREYVLEENPMLKSRYSVDDGNMEVLYLKEAKATFESFGKEPKVINF